MDHQEIYDQVCRITEYLRVQGKLKLGAVMVLGCSSSEVGGQTIGKARNPELGKVLAEAFLETCANMGIGGAFAWIIRRFTIRYAASRNICACRGN